MATDPPQWRPIRPGEDVFEYHRTVDKPMRIAGMVDYVCRLPTNAERGRFLRGLAKVQGQEFADRIRREAWQRLRARTSAARKLSTPPSAFGNL